MKNTPTADDKADFQYYEHSAPHFTEGGELFSCYYEKNLMLHRF